jgi:hypothetical protein
VCVRVRACAGACARVFACGRSCVHAFACVRVRVRGCACGCARVCLRARVRASARVLCSAAFDFINADFRCRSADATCHATPHCNDDDADVFVSAEGRCRGSCRSRNHSLGQPTGACIHACTYHRAQHALTHPRTCTHTRALSRRAQAPSLRSDTLSWVRQRLSERVQPSDLLRMRRESHAQTRHDKERRHARRARVVYRVHLRCTDVSTLVRSSRSRPTTRSTALRGCHRNGTALTRLVGFTERCESRRQGRGREG